MKTTYKIACRPVNINCFLVLCACCITLLLMSGCGKRVSITAEDRASFTAEEQQEIEKFLAEYGSNLENNKRKKDGRGDTLLHTAAMDGNLTIVKFLVSKGANVHAKWHGRTPLETVKSSEQLDRNVSNKINEKIGISGSTNRKSKQADVIEYLTSLEK